MARIEQSGQAERTITVISPVSGVVVKKEVVPGMRIEAAEALRIGLVDRVLPDAELWNATMEIARTISGNAPLAIKAAKITIAEVLKDESKRDMDAIKKIGTACMDSEDFREGRTAFMEKRKPQFKGK